MIAELSRARQIAGNEIARRLDAALVEAGCDHEQDTKSRDAESRLVAGNAVVAKPAEQTPLIAV